LSLPSAGVDVDLLRPRFPDCPQIGVVGVSRPNAARLAIMALRLGGIGIGAGDVTAPREEEYDRQVRLRAVRTPDV